MMKWPYPKTTKTLPENNKITGQIPDIRQSAFYSRGYDPTVFFFTDLGFKSQIRVKIVRQDCPTHHRTFTSHEKL
jgi:hypothetical protein